MWLDLQAEILEDIGSVSVSEHDRMIYDVWRANGNARARASERIKREKNKFACRVLRAIERKRVASTQWGMLATPEAIDRAKSVRKWCPAHA